MVTDNASVSRTQPDSSQTESGHRRWWVIGGLLITLFTAAIVALGIYLNTGRIHWEDRAYEIVDDQTATLTFEIYRPAHTAVVCRVRAIALDFSTVGTLDVTIPADAAGGERTVREDVTVRTTTRANTVTVGACVPEGERSR